MQKPSSNPKEETKIEGEEVDHEQEPVPREPYKLPKSVHEMKVNDDFKEDNVRPFDFQEEIDRIREENEFLKDRIAKLETRMTAEEINIKDINHNDEELSQDVDNSKTCTHSS
ncbi:hypothetical protein M9Y10_035319 [Tritrichomonas musculus]|uniref:Uncharacterized protein n=1 Tax=Tritrichomonas musculus TaxID=1915356 RepID=A0ABR2KHF0_9EUKA